MKTTYTKVFMGLCLVLLLAVMTACSTGNEKGGSDNKGATDGGSKPNTSSNSNTNKGGDDTAAPANIEPLGKYDPPIEVTMVKVVNDTYKYKDGDKIDDNIWMDAYKDELGITIKYDWVVSGDGVGGPGEQKMNVTIASGDLPDIIPVNATQLQQLIQADLVMSLDELFEQYATPLTKRIITEDGGVGLDSATFGGKLMAIPNTNSSMDGAAMVWLRSDWLQKLNLSEPKSLDDVLEIARAFAKADFDGNGQDDTVGIALYKDLMGGYAGLDGFFNSYHAYPNSWIKNAQGELEFGSIQPEVRQALIHLNELYQEGLIDREFGVMDSTKAGEAQGAGRNGLHFGQMWNPLSPLGASKENDPEAQWQAYPLASMDGQPARPQVGLAVNGYFAVNKNAKNPEAVMKLLNLWMEKFFGESADVKYQTYDGVEVFKYAPVQAWKARKNLDIHHMTSEAMDTGDTSKLDPEQLHMYELMNSYLKGEEGPVSNWAYERVFGKTGAFQVIDHYVTNDLLMMNAFTGAPTPTMVSKQSTLAKMEIEVFTKIIMGSSPIEEFDKFVENWKKTGGDDMTREVNEWFKSK